MIEFVEGHPCQGKECSQCETCIFDRDLFVDGITPNERFKNNNVNNMEGIRLCNQCVNLTRNDKNCMEGRFDAACKVVSYTAFGETRQRKIDFNVAPNQDIISPIWCPLRESKAQLLLTAQPQVSSRPNPQNTGPQPSHSSNVGFTSYSDKRERMKQLRKHIEWDDIKEGHVYVIPKILTQSRKLVKVVTKTSMCCTCREISEITGNEFAYNCTIYPSDIDTVFITELHNF